MFSWQLLRDKGRPEPPHLLCQGRQGRSDRRARRALRSRRQRRPRAAADPRADAGAGQARRRSRRRSRRPRSSRRSAAAPMSSAEVDPGKSVTLKRNPNYWGRDLAINRGFWNFDEVRFDYYRDANSHLEAFKRGLYDVRNEHDPGTLADGLRFPGRARRPRRQGGAADRPAEGEHILRVQHAPRDLRRHPRARGDLAAVRLRMDQPQLLLRPLPAHAELFRRLGAVVARPAGR